MGLALVVILKNNKLGELLEHPVRLLIQNLHNSNKIGLKLRESNPNKRQINQIDNDGNIINTYQSIREAARQLGNIRKDANIISGIKTHQKRYGYYWEYASV